MANVRMVYIEADVDGPQAVASLMRMAMTGMEAQEAPPALPAPAVPVALVAAPDLCSDRDTAREERRYPRRHAVRPVKKVPVRKDAPREREVPGEASVPQQVLEMIRKGPPRTTGELYDELRKQGFTGTNGAVYQACKFWRDKGSVVSKADDSDGGGGVMKQYFVGGK